VCRRTVRERGHWRPACWGRMPAVWSWLFVHVPSSLCHLPGVLAGELHAAAAVVVVAAAAVACRRHLVLRRPLQPHPWPQPLVSIGPVLRCSELPRRPRSASAACSFVMAICQHEHSHGFKARRGEIWTHVKVRVPS